MGSQRRGSVRGVKEDARNSGQTFHLPSRPFHFPGPGLLLIPIPHFSGQPGTHPASRGGRSSQELSQLRSSPKRLPSRPIRGTRGAGPASPGHAAPLLTRRRRNRSHAGSRSQVLRARRGRAARSASCVRGFPQCPAPAAAATAAAL